MYIKCIEFYKTEFICYGGIVYLDMTFQCSEPTVINDSGHNVSNPQFSEKCDQKRFVEDRCIVKGKLR